MKKKPMPTAREDKRAQRSPPAEAAGGPAVEPREEEGSSATRPGRRDGPKGDEKTDESGAEVT